MAGSKAPVARAEDGETAPTKDKNGFPRRRRSFGRRQRGKSGGDFSSEVFHGCDSDGKPRSLEGDRREHGDGDNARIT